MEQLTILFDEILKDEAFLKAVFSGKRKKSMEYSKILLRPIIIGGSRKFQAEFSFDKKVTHRNMDYDEALSFSLSTLSEDFKQANIFMSDREIQVLAAKPDNPRISETGAAQTAVKTPNLEHNKRKNYIIPDGLPCDFLIKLGVTDNKGKVFQRSYSKFRQINRFLEILEDVFPSLPLDRPLKIIDFGCGKAYLTFALYHYIKVLKGRDAEIIGLDLKEDVISFCNDVAKDLGYEKLSFIMGDIADFTAESVDMVVTLHACDTATDYALINAVNWGAQVILSVPCCQHQLFKQIKNDIHAPMLKHGILKDRLTEYLTDGLRGLKLEEKGYDVAMIEFTTLEHTAKNIMIKAVKRRNHNSLRAAAFRKQYEALRDFYQVMPTIDKM